MLPGYFAIIFLQRDTDLEAFFLFAGVSPKLMLWNANWASCKSFSAFAIECAQKVASPNGPAKIHCIAGFGWWVGVLAHTTEETSEERSYDPANNH